MYWTEFYIPRVSLKLNYGPIKYENSYFRQEYTNNILSTIIYHTNLDQYNVVANNSGWVLDLVFCFSCTIRLPLSSCFKRFVASIV